MWTTIRHGHYMVPLRPGYSGEILAGSLDQFMYPNGAAWEGIFDLAIAGWET
jgi:hypothetical protein